MKNTVNFGSLCGLVVALGLAITTGSPAIAGAGQVAAQDESYRQSVEDWRARRHASLSRPDGWLTLVGLDRLRLPAFERYAHALAGGAVLTCGLAIAFLGL